MLDPKKDTRTLEDRLGDLDPTLPAHKQAIAKLKYLIWVRDGKQESPVQARQEAAPAPRKFPPLFPKPVHESQKPEDDN